MDTLIQASYFLAAFLFIMGLKRMSSPVTAVGGIIWAVRIVLRENSGAGATATENSEVFRSSRRISPDFS